MKKQTQPNNMTINFNASNPNNNDLLSLIEEPPDPDGRIEIVNASP